MVNAHTLVSSDIRIENLDALKDESLKEISVISATPSFLKLLLANPDFSFEHYKKLKFIFSCGEILEPRLAEKIFNRFPSVKLFNAYGPSEAVCAVSGSFIEPQMCDKAVLPMGDVKNAAVKIEIQNEKIILKGESVFNGYIGIFCDETVYKENDINCFNTNDNGFIKDGQLFFKGRNDTQVKYSGYRIDLLDIELNLKSIDDIEDAAVIAKCDKIENVVSINAYVVSDLSEGEIKEKLALKIPKYMIPKKIVFLDKIPLNKNGKTDRKYLEKL